MENKLKIIAFLPILLISSCSNFNDNKGQGKQENEVETGNEIPNPEPTKQEKYKLKREKSLIADPNFENGFYLISPESTNQFKEKDLDYNGTADKKTFGKGERTNYWEMCQWWTPFNFKDAPYNKNGDIHEYQNESRYLGVNTKTGEITMKLDSDLEYKELYTTGVKPASASWSHFLIQQSFTDELKLSPSSINTSEEGLHVTFDITVNEATYKLAGTPTGSDCAQLNFYFILRNYVEDGSDPNKVGRNGTRIWFGLPIFDSRYTTIEKYIAVDEGFQGATNALIYSLPSKYYLGNKPFEIGKKYHVDIDVLEYLQEAFVYGAQNNYLLNCQWQNMKVDYMNFGWELPGNYKVASTLSNLDIYVG